MKRKIILFLNISMLAICVCAIAFGVYSAQMAQLNMGGNLGFSAHNASVQVTGAIRNVAVVENDNVVGKTDIPINKIIKSDNSTVVNSSLSLGNFYFYSTDNSTATTDYIVIELTFTNLGTTKVKATISKPTVPTNVSVVSNTSLDYILFNTSSKHIAGIRVGGSTTIKCALKLNSTSLSLSTFSMAISFAEDTSSDFYIKQGVFKKYTSDATTNVYRNYVDFGQVSATDTTPLRWYIFAKDSVAVNIAAITTDCILTPGTYWFISEYALDARAFGSNNTYNTSTIKTYLSGTGATSFIGAHNISTSNEIYSKIGTRTLQDSADATNHIAALTKVSNQKLWLLSVNELKYLNGGTACSTLRSSNEKIYYPSLITDQLSGPSPNWWLRTPSDDSAGTGAFVVTGSSSDVGPQRAGGIVDCNVGYDFYVRPAFQITI